VSRLHTWLQLCPKLLRRLSTRSTLVLVAATLRCNLHEPALHSRADQSQSSRLIHSPSPTRSVPSAPSVASVPVIDAPHLTGGTGSVRGEFGLVTSVEETATRAGVAILEAGGNAIDAAITTAFVLAVTHPSAGNLGGGGFLLVRPAHGSTLAIDFRETAPQALTQQKFDKMIAQGAEGAAAVGIPGTVAGLWLAHQKLGKTPWRELLAPAIELAEAGHRVGAREALTIQWNWAKLRKTRETREAFGTPKGLPLPTGSLVKHPNLARSLRLIAERGRAGFYAGPIAEALTHLGPEGLITQGDLERYEAKLRAPLMLNYRGWQIETMPPPSAGGVSLVILLRILAQQGSEQFARNSVEGLHLFAEASQRAQAERRFSVTDPDRLPLSETEATRQHWLTGPLPFADHPILANSKTPSPTLHPLYAQALKELEHTTQLSVSDAEGMLVSLTTTLSAGFGAKICAPGTGIVLNNSVAAFGTGGVNTIAPGFRSVSSMAPTLATHPSGTTLVLGSPGGDTIPTTIGQILTDLVDHRSTLADAVRATRVHHGFVPDTLHYERDRPLPANVISGLKQKGHRVKARSSFGDANNLLIVQGIGYAIADEREGGLALAATQRAN